MHLFFMKSRMCATCQDCVFCMQSQSPMGCPRNIGNGWGPEVLAIPETKQSPMSTIHLPGKHVETVATLLYLLNNFQPSSIYYISRTAHWNEYKLLPHYNVSSQDHGHFEYLLPSTYSWDYSNCRKFGNQDMIPNVMFKTRLTKNGLIFTNIIKCCETFISWCFYFFMFKQQHHLWTLNINSNF